MDYMNDNPMSDSDSDSDYSDDPIVGYMEHTEAEAIVEDDTIIISITLKFNNMSNKPTPKNFEINWINAWGGDTVVEQILHTYRDDLIDYTWDDNKVTIVINKKKYIPKKILSDIDMGICIGARDDRYTESFWVVHNIGLREMAEMAEMAEKEKYVIYWTGVLNGAKQVDI